MHNESTNSQESHLPSGAVPATKLLVFAMNGEESVRLADKVAMLLSRLGHEITIFEYWDREFDDPGLPSRLAGIPIFPLAPGGFNALPRLTRKQYAAACGDDIDFASVVQHSVAGECWESNGAIAQSRLDPESVYYQRLRGAAHKIDAIYRAMQPTAIVIGHGSEAVARILIAKALQAEIPILVSESSFFPGYIALDPCGQHFIPGHNMIDTDWNTVVKTPLTDEREKWVRRFIEEWRTAGTSKYPQATTIEEERVVTEFLDRDSRPSLFVPMQVASDANVYFGLDELPSLREFYQRLIDKLTPRFKLIFKRHPKDRREADLIPIQKNDGLVVDSVSIHFLILSTTATLTFSSNVGLEALLHGKPVIVGGRPYYRDKGLTLDFEFVCQSESPSDVVAAWHPPTDIVLKLVGYLCKRYLIPEDDPDRMSARLLDACDSRYKLRTDLRRPFHEQAPLFARELYGLIISGAELFCENRDANDLANIVGLPAGIDRIVEDPSELDAANRAVTPWLHQTDTALLARYAFVASQLPAEARVLDLYCDIGCGAYTLAHTSSCKVDAVDTSLARVRYARQHWSHHGICYTTASAAGFLDRIEEHTYDFVVSHGTVSRMGDPQRFLRHAWSAVKPGGKLVISAIDSPIDGNTFHDSSINLAFPGTLTAFAKAVPDCESIYLYQQNGLVILHEPEPTSPDVIGLLTKGDPVRPSWSDSPCALEMFEYQPAPRVPTSLAELARALVTLRVSELVLLAEALERRRPSIRDEFGLASLGLAEVFCCIFGNRLVKRLVLANHDQGNAERHRR
ncbi:MAG: methyltransferase domain-containing protein [Sulfuritalea sp.]|nr:methyltransferase domain-containing protein [Sulfuritalea sp.]